MIKPIGKLALGALIFLCVSVQALAFTDLLPLLGDIPGYTGTSAEGSSLKLPEGEVDIVSRTYTDRSATLIASIYRGGELKALAEHGISAGVVTKTENIDGYIRSITESGIKKGYIFIYKDGNPVKLILEYGGISSSDALKLVQELNPERLFGSE